MASLGHKTQKPPTTPKSFPVSTSAEGASRPPLPRLQPASAGYLLYQLPPGPPPSRLHGDNYAFGQPVLGRGPGLLLCRQLDTQPALQLRNELLLGWVPAQGGRVQPAARGGFPGHGMYVACLPAPPDHRADLGEEDKASPSHCKLRQNATQSTRGVTEGQSRTTQRQDGVGDSRKQTELKRVLSPSIHSQVSL